MPSMFSSIPMAVVGGLVVIVGLFAIYGLFAKVNEWRSPDDEQDTKKRLENDARPGTRDYDVGLFTRASSWTFPMKATVAIFIGAFLFVIIQLYRFSKTGTPASSEFAPIVQRGVFALICIVGGIWVWRRQNNKVGEIKALIEGKDSRPVTYYYDKSKVTPVTDEEGDRVAMRFPLFKDRRFLGFFWRPLLSADRDDLRDREHRRPEDRVIFRAETGDGSVIYDEVSEEVHIRAKRIRPVDDANKHADLEAIPSDRKSQTEVNDIMAEKQELEEELRFEQRRNAVYSKQITQLEEWVESLEAQSENRFQDHLEQVKELLEIGYGGRGGPGGSSGSSGSGSGEESVAD